MRKLLAPIAGGLFLAASVAAAAAPSGQTPAGVWVDLHFAGSASGRTATITETVSLRSPALAESYCRVDLARDGAEISHGAFLAHRELAGLSFKSANCQTDKNGHIRMAVGSWPKGEGPRPASEATIMAWAPKMQPALFDGPPAVVMLQYKASNGRTVRILGGYQSGAPPFYMRTCPEKLKQTLPEILQGAHRSLVHSEAIGNKYPYDIQTLKFVRATCEPPPKNIGAFYRAASK